MTSSTMSNRGIGIMNADGTGMRTLIPGYGHVNEDPAWSPDGQRIAFQSNRTGAYQIYVMKADGSDQRNLSRNSANEYWPNWRPFQRPIAPSTDGGRLRVRLPRSGQGS
jgi:TolB protein